MSAFSRGTLLWSQCAAKSGPRSFHHPSEAICTQFTALRKVTYGNHLTTSREFSSAPILRASKKIRAAYAAQRSRGPTPKKSTHKTNTLPDQTPAKKASTKSPPKIITLSKAPTPPKPSSLISHDAPTTNVASTYTTFSSTLAQKPYPTLLYEAPSHTGLFFTVLPLSLISFGTGAVIYNEMVVDPNPGLPFWVPLTYVFVSFGFGVTSIWLARKPFGIIKSLTTVPSAIGQSSKLMVEAQIRTLPYLPEKKFVVAASSILLPRAITGVTPPLSPAEQFAKSQAEAEERVKQLQYEHDHVYTRPIRHAKYAFVSGLKRIRRSMSKSAFMKVQVDGTKYKLDTDGWMLDKGKAIDRLFTIKP